MSSSRHTPTYANRKKDKREEVEQMVPCGVGEDTSMLITEWD